MEMGLRDRLRRAMLRDGDIASGDRYLLACSGGLDSSVLAHLLYAEGYAFTLAHMNYQLRGAESQADEVFVRGLAVRFGVECLVRRVDVGAEALAGESLQMSCRRLRYAWFEELYSGDGGHTFAFVVTAHHRDDDFETALINLIRGTGARGMGGIRRWRARPPTLRPLLGLAGRADLLAYAEANGLDWREDASNATDAYLRNRVRHHLTPLLADRFGLDAAGWAARTKGPMESDALLARAGYKLLLEQYLEATTVEEQAAVLRAPRSWSLFHQEFYEVLLTRWLTDPQGWGFTKEQVRQLRESPGGRVRGNAYEVELRPDGGVTVWHLRHPTPLPSLVIDALPYSLTYRSSLTLDLTVVSRPEQLDRAKGWFVAYRPGQTLHLRPRRNGDRMQPLGMGGKSKKVKDYLIDRKVPRRQRDNLYLLTDEKDTILALVGLCVTEAGRVGPEDELVLRITTVPNT